MGRVFVAHADAVELTALQGKTFADVVAAAKAEVADLTWQELARYNWGTDDPAEVNRALIETIGCRTIDPTDPNRAELDPALGPGGAVKVLLPRLWTAPTVELEKVLTVTVARREPVPAVAITELDRWFVPRRDACKLAYRLEGTAARANLVDVEVHATGYHELDQHGNPRPCATDGSEPESTHILRRRRVLEVTTRRPPDRPIREDTWRGESTAANGVLKGTASAPAYITHACAPYHVLVRYYKSAGDENARIMLAPFAPRWKPTTLEPIDETFVVTWDIRNDNGQLKAGQLLVLDRSDSVVFRAVLDAKRLRTDRKYDLLKDAAHRWDRARIARADGPFRVQLQAHSDQTEANGLALAVMPTEVKAFAYEKAQFIGFNVQPGTRQKPPGYLGDKDDQTDISRRCEVMKHAIRQAAASGAIDRSDSVLKIFMAPEFFFRGAKGGYALEQVFSIGDRLAEETDRFEYADWLFVFGTAIGYLPHGSPRHPREKDLRSTHSVQIRDVLGEQVTKVRISGPAAAAIDTSVRLGVACVIRQESLEAKVKLCNLESPDVCLLTLDGKLAMKRGPAEVVEPTTWIIAAKTSSTGDTVLEVRSPLVRRIPYTIGASPAESWKIEQGSVVADVDRAEARLDSGLIQLAGAHGFVPGEARLIEPAATEVFNVALVRKGWPAAALSSGLRSAGIYKEYISSIDFLGPNFDRAEWHAAGGGGRKIRIHGAGGRMVLPTAGSADWLGASPNWLPDPSQPATVRHWTDPEGTDHVVGSEINASGIGGGSVVTIDGITFGIEVCLDHLMGRVADFYRNNHASPGDPRVQIQLIPSWGMSIGAGPIECVPKGLVFNVDGARVESVARVHDGTFSCDDHPAVVGAGATPCPQCTRTVSYFHCATCNSAYSSTGTQCPACGSSGNRTLYWCAACDQYWFGPTCGTCGTGALPSSRSFTESLKPIGAPIAEAASVTVDLASIQPSWTDYFAREAPLVVYRPADIPRGQIV